MHHHHPADGLSRSARPTGRVAVLTVVLALLLLSVGAPALGLSARWDTSSYAGWPGLGLSFLLLAMAGRRARRWVFLVQTVALGVVMAVTYDVPWWAGAAASLTITVPAALALHLLRPGTEIGRAHV